jgi:hypothetical protein
MSQKVVQYQAVMQLAQQAPQLYDLPYLHRQMLEVLGIKNASKLVPMEDDQKPKDPVSENMAVLTGKPVKAFMYQDHQAHIAVHVSAMQDPKLAEMIGQSPMAQQIGGAMAAHIQEHLAFEYRKQIEEMAGIPYPAPDTEMDEDTEVQVSRLAAAAAAKVVQASQANAAQQQAQQAAQDPIVQMQQAELQIKAKEVELKEKKLLADAASKADQLDIERDRIATQKEIAAMQAGIKLFTEQANLDADQKAQAAKFSLDLATRVSQEELQERQTREAQARAQVQQNNPQNTGE